MKRNFMGMAFAIGLLSISLCGCGNKEIQMSEIEIPSGAIAQELIEEVESVEIVGEAVVDYQEIVQGEIKEKDEQINSIDENKEDVDKIPETIEDESNEKNEKTGKEGFVVIGESHAVIAEGYGYAKLGSSVEGIVLNDNLFFVHTAMDPVMGTYEWFSTDGANRIEQIIREHDEVDNWTIISIHGTSMTTIEGIADNYIDTYKDWMKKRFASCNLYIVSVPPIDEVKWNEVHPDIPRNNDQIKEFNKKIKKNFSKNYFDFYDWIVENGEFIDEIHYSGKTYVTMFDQVIAKVRTNQ